MPRLAQISESGIVPLLYNATAVSAFQLVSTGLLLPTLRHSLAEYLRTNLRRRTGQDQMDIGHGLTQRFVCSQSVRLRRSRSYPVRPASEGRTHEIRTHGYRNPHAAPRPVASSGRHSSCYPTWISTQLSLGRP